MPSEKSSFQFDPLFQTNEDAAIEDASMSNSGNFTLKMLMASESTIGGAYAKPAGADDTVQVKIGTDGYFYVKKYPSTPEEVGALPKDATAVRAASDADGNNIIETYATKAELDALPLDQYLAKTDFETYKTSVADTYSLKTDLDDYKILVEKTYATKSELSVAQTNASNTYATKTQFTDETANVAKTYATKDELSTAKTDASSKYATKTQLSTSESNIAETYATKIELEAEKTNASNTYATKIQLSDAQTDIGETYATKSELTASDGKVSDTYATKTELNNAKSSADSIYATKDELTSSVGELSRVEDSESVHYPTVTIGDRLTIGTDGTLSANDQTGDINNLIDKRIAAKSTVDFNIKGAVDSISGLPSSADNGDIYYVRDIEDYKVYMDGTWAPYNESANAYVKGKVLVIE